MVGVARLESATPSPRTRFRLPACAQRGSNQYPGCFKPESHSVWGKMWYPRCHMHRQDDYERAMRTIRSAGDVVARVRIELTTPRFSDGPGRACGAGSASTEADTVLQSLLFLMGMLARLLAK